MTSQLSETSTTLFPNLPDRARVWVYCTDRQLSESDERSVQDVLNRFVSSWKSHGRQINGACTVLLRRFIVIAGDIPGGDVSGCGIDASTHALDAIGSELGFGFLPSLEMAYQLPGEPVQTTSRPEMKRLVTSGELPQMTRIFNFSVTDLGSLRSGAFDPVVEDSWYSRFLNAETN